VSSLLEHLSAAKMFVLFHSVLFCSTRQTQKEKPRIAKDKKGNFVEHVAYNDREFLEASPEEQMKIIGQKQVLLRVNIQDDHKYFEKYDPLFCYS